MIFWFDRFGTFWSHKKRWRRTHFGFKLDFVNLFIPKKLKKKLKSTGSNRSMTDLSRLWPIQHRFLPGMSHTVWLKWIHSCNLLALENYQNLHFAVFLVAVIGFELLVVGHLAADWAVLMLHCKYPFDFDWRQLKIFLVMWSYFISRDKIFGHMIFHEIIWTCSINGKSWR